MMGVHPMPDHVDALGIGNQLRQHASDERRIVGQFIALVGTDQELETPNAVGDRDRDIRTPRIRADLAVRMAQWIIRDVDDEPARRGRGAVERHPHQAAGGAAATVAPHDIAGAHGVLAIRELDGDAVGCFDAGLHPVAEPDLDVLEPLQAAEQFGVDHRLDEAVALGPPESGVGRRHLGEQAALGIEEPQDLVRHGVRQHAVDQADRLEGTQRLVVKADATRIVDQGHAAGGR